MKKFLKIVLFCFISLTIYMGVLYFGQIDFLFYPDRKYKSPADISLPMFSENVLKASDGTDIMTWYYKGKEDKPALLFLHGNAGQIAAFAPFLTPIIDEGYSLLIMEYRGFANTKGTISQKDITQDATLAFDWLKDKGHPKIIVYGYSFGSAFACSLVNVRQADGLILMAPFSSLEKIVSEKPVPFAKFALKDKYMSIDYVKKYKSPLLIVHGEKDRLISPHHGQILFDNASSQDKQIHVLNGETHASVFFGKSNIPFVLRFLKERWP